MTSTPAQNLKKVNRANQLRRTILDLLKTASEDPEAVTELLRAARSSLPPASLAASAPSEQLPRESLSHYDLEELLSAAEGSTVTFTVVKGDTRYEVTYAVAEKSTALRLPPRVEFIDDPYRKSRGYDAAVYVALRDFEPVRIRAVRNTDSGGV